MTSKKQKQTSARKFAVGQRVWEFDQNHRVYVEGQIGPVFSEHFRPYKVVGIEGRSYRIGAGSDPERRSSLVGFAKAEKTYYTDEEKAEAIWEDSHRYRIVDQVKRVDVRALRKIAELIGYKAD
jgi:hypothetical protein